MDVLNINGRGLKKSLAGSLIIHAIVLSAALILFNEPGRQFVSPVYTVDLVGAGGLKEKTPVRNALPPALPEARQKEDVKAPPAKELKKTEPKQEAKPSPKETVKIKEQSDPAVSEAVKRMAENIKKKQENALVSSKVEDIRKKKEADSKYASERLGEIKKELSKNETAAASAPQKPASERGGGGTVTGGGLSSGSLQAKYPAYYNVIHDRVQENWVYPEGFELSKVSVIASMRISRAGALLDVWLEKSSGNARFDQSLLDAVRKAAPFPPLPQDLEGGNLETGLRFCPNCTE